MDPTQTVGGRVGLGRAVQPSSSSDHSSSLSFPASQQTCFSLPGVAETVQPPMCGYSSHSPTLLSPTLDPTQTAGGRLGLGGAVQPSSSSGHSSSLSFPAPQPPCSPLPGVAETVQPPISGYSSHGPAPLSEEPSAEKQPSQQNVKRKKSTRIKLPVPTVSEKVGSYLEDLMDWIRDPDLNHVHAVQHAGRRLEACCTEVEKLERQHLSSLQNISEAELSLKMAQQKLMDIDADIKSRDEKLKAALDEYQKRAMEQAAMHTDLESREAAFAHEKESVRSLDRSLLVKATELRGGEAILISKEKELKHLESDLKRREAMYQEHASEANARTRELGAIEVAIQQRENLLAGREKSVAQMDKSFALRERTVSERDTAVSERDAAVRAREGRLDEKLSAVGDRERTVCESEKALTDKQRQHEKKEATIAEREKRMDDRDIGFREKDLFLEDRERKLKDKDIAMAGREQKLNDRDVALELRFHDREKKFSEREDAMAEREARVNEREHMVTTRETSVKSLEDKAASTVNTELNTIMKQLHQLSLDTHNKLEAELREEIMKQKTEVARLTNENRSVSQQNSELLADKEEREEELRRLNINVEEMRTRWREKKRGLQAELQQAKDELRQAKDGEPPRKVPRLSSASGPSRSASHQSGPFPSLGQDQTGREQPVHTEGPPDVLKKVSVWSGSDDQGPQTVGVDVLGKDMLAVLKPHMEGIASNPRFLKSLEIPKDGKLMCLRRRISCKAAEVPLQADGSDWAACTWCTERKYPCVLVTQSHGNVLVPLREGLRKGSVRDVSFYLVE